MRICLHTFWSIEQNFIGGTERFIIELCKELNVLGFDAFIVCSGEKSKKIVDGVPVFSALPDWARSDFSEFGEAKAKLFKRLFVEGRTRRQGLVRLARYAEEQLEGFDYDLLHLNSFASAIFTKSTKNIVVTNHENEQETANLWGNGAFKDFSECAKINESTFGNHLALVVPTRHYAKVYSKFFETDVIGIHQGANLLNFPRAPVRPVCDKKEITLLLPSRIEPYQKGQDLAVRALAEVRSSGLNAKFIFSGVRNDNQHNIEELRSLADQMRIKAHIEFTCFADMSEAYEQCDIVVSPERYCSFGLSVSEALAVGKPTVLSNIPTYMEISRGFAHAYQFQSNNHTDLAAKILDASSELDVKRSHDIFRFREQFDFRECAKTYGRLYSGVTS